jgi:hypothetical protein
METQERDHAASRHTMYPLQQQPFFYTAYGLTIASELACSQLLPGSGPPDVTIRYGQVPVLITAACNRVAAYDSTPTTLRLEIRSLGRYLVTAGKTVIIEPDPAGNEADLRAFLLGAVWGALLHQRGSLVLHGSAVATPQGAVVFVAPSGYGKSTLAAAFQQRGHQVLADDVCAVSSDADGAPQVFPAFPQLRLRADVVRHLNVEDAFPPQSRFDPNKYTLPVGQSFLAHPLPLYAVYELHTTDTSTLSLVPTQGRAKLDVLLRNVYRRYWLQGMGKTPATFQHCLAVAQRINVRQVVRPQHPLLLDALVDLITRDLLR